MDINKIKKNLRLENIPTDKNYLKFLMKHIKREKMWGCWSIGILPKLKMKPLEYVLKNKLLKENGLILEFGVYKGTTINLISNYVDKVYGFDSFLGLPENNEQLNNKTWIKGKFNLDKKLPKVNDNVELIVGWFNETIDKFIKQHSNETISLIHIDCDLYISTKIIFDKLGHLINKNTILIFDELINYPGYERGEMKAFYEFITQNNKNFKWIGSGIPGFGHQNVGVHIL